MGKTLNFALGVSGQTNPNLIINASEIINQRGVANWASVANLVYGFDRWQKVDASTKRQWIEVNSYLHSTVYTISGTGITTAQITSPASGNWPVTAPIGATNIKLELGSVATLYIPDIPAVNTIKCQRFFSKSFDVVTTPANGVNATQFALETGMVQGVSSNTGRAGQVYYPTTMRTNPVIVRYGNNVGHGRHVVISTGVVVYNNLSAAIANAGTQSFAYSQQIVSSTLLAINFHWTADAELTAV